MSATRGTIAGLTCASLVDAMGRLHGHRAHLPSLVSPTPDRPLFGPAATIAYLPFRDDLPESELGFGELYERAVGEQRRGRVLVLSSGGYPDLSHAGGTKLARLQRDALAGVLVDGRLRDFAELARFDFASWCRGEATRWGGNTAMPFAADVPVEVAGVGIVPGDHVYADATGGVVIPAASLARVLREARSIEDEDAATVATILRGDGGAPR